MTLSLSRASDSATVAYSRLHAAFARAGESFRVEPMVARVALAISDDGGAARTDDLAAALRCEGAAVRRAVLRMYDCGLAVGVAVDGGRRRPGMRTVVRLTVRGRALVEAVLAEAGELAA